MHSASTNADDWKSSPRDLFDIYYKSNWRNLEIVLDHFDMSIEDLRRLR